MSTLHTMRIMAPVAFPWVPSFRMARCLVSPTATPMPASHDWPSAEGVGVLIEQPDANYSTCAVYLGRSDPPPALTCEGGDDPSQ